MKTKSLRSKFILFALVLLSFLGCKTGQVEKETVPNKAETPKEIKTEISSESLAERLGKKNVQIKKKAEEGEFIKPDPLYLVVFITQGGSTPKYKLNQDGEFTPDELTKKLKTLFESRQKTGYFRPGSNEIEKTINLLAAPQNIADYKAKNLQVEDFEKLVDLLQSIGAGPIVLDFNNNTSEVEKPDDLLPPPTNQKPASNVEKSKSNK
ncbi:MAG: hypothetical protein K1X72_12035 [Pyrinomonadaceae bacterium]|nr:hypothetical protein [Pyrinomonadaceae bacterium]